MTLPARVQAHVYGSILFVFECLDVSGRSAGKVSTLFKVGLAQMNARKQTRRAKQNGV